MSDEALLSDSLPEHDLAVRQRQAESIARNTVAHTVIAIFGGWDNYAQNQELLTHNTLALDRAMEYAKLSGADWQETVQPTLKGTDEQVRHLTTAVVLYGEAVRSGLDPERLKAYAASKYPPTREIPNPVHYYGVHFTTDPYHDRWQHERDIEAEGGPGFGLPEQPGSVLG